MQPAWLVLTLVKHAAALQTIVHLAILEVMLIMVCACHAAHHLAMDAQVNRRSVILALLGTILVMVYAYPVL